MTRLHEKKTDGSDSSKLFLHVWVLLALSIGPIGYSAVLLRLGRGRQALWRIEGRKLYLLYRTVVKLCQAVELSSFGNCHGLPQLSWLYSGIGEPIDEAPKHRTRRDRYQSIHSPRTGFSSRSSQSGSRHLFMHLNTRPSGETTRSVFHYITVQS